MRASLRGADIRSLPGRGVKVIKRQLKLIMMRRRVRIVMPDDRLSDMNDVLLVDGGWHVLQHQPASP
jgi:hypothetical protein